MFSLSQYPVCVNLIRSVYDYIDGLMQDCGDTNAYALDVPLSHD